MVEAGFLVSQLADAALQQGGGQTLPAAQAKDADRFQELMKGEGKVSTAIQPQSMDDSSVLQFAGPGQADNSSGLVDRMINQMTKIDSNYHSILDEMGNRPGLDAYLNNQKDAVDSSMMTYPNVSVESAKPDPHEAALQGMQEMNTATLKYQADMNNWSMNFRMWSAGVEVIAAAAKKVSQGFQTLFRASG